MIGTSFIAAALRCVLRLLTAPLGLVGLLLRIGGTDAEEIRKHGERERSTAVIQGALSLMNWIYVTIVASFALSVLFPPPAGNSIWCAAVAMVIASMICGIDLMIVRAAWAWHGMASLRQAGLVTSTAWVQRLLPAALLTLRFCLSYETAQLVAMLLLLHVVHPDLVQDVQRFNHQQEQSLYDDATKTVDSIITGQNADAAAADERLTKLEADMANVRAIDTNPGGQDVTAANEEVRMLEASQGTAIAEAQRYRQLAISEKLGRGEGTSGVAGQGPVYESDIDHAALADQAAARFADQAAKARQARDAAQQRQDAARADAEQRKDARLTELAAQVAAARKARDAVHATVAATILARQDTITGLVAKNPAHLPPSNGPVAMFKAFRRVAADPGIAPWITMIMFVAMGLELSAVLAKLLIRIPGTYSTDLAAKDILLYPLRKLAEIQRVQASLADAMRRHAASLNARAGFARRDRQQQQPPARGTGRGGNRRVAPPGRQAGRND
jgi:hypothetical protein